LETGIEIVQLTTDAPLVSVVVGAYNCERYIAIAIESALAQTERRLEVVVVDDASSDRTADVARTYEVTGRVRVLSNGTNAGPSGARNRAISAARGTWVAQLDGDDWMSINRVERLLDAAARSAADFVIDDLLLVDDASMKPVSTRFIDMNVPWKRLTVFGHDELVHYDLGSVKPLMRRQFIQEHGLVYPEHIRYGEDFLFLMRALGLGARFAALPEANYRMRRGNTGSLTTEKASLYCETERITLQLLAEDEIRAQPLLCRALERRLRYLRQLAALEALKAALKRGDGVAQRLLSHPGVLIPLVQRLPAVLAKRMRYTSRRQVLADFQAPSVLGVDAFLAPTITRG